MNEKQKQNLKWAIGRSIADARTGGDIYASINRRMKQAFPGEEPNQATANLISMAVHRAVLTGNLSVANEVLRMLSGGGK